MYPPKKCPAPFAPGVLIAIDIWVEAIDVFQGVGGEEDAKVKMSKSFTLV